LDNWNQNTMLARAAHRASKTAGISAVRAMSTGTPPVMSHTEWDKLEEVIVGTTKGATVPMWDDVIKAVAPNKWEDFFRTNAGKPFPEDLMIKGEEEFDNLQKILEGEGITVRRPEVLSATGDFGKGFKTPDFEAAAGLYAAMPRDVLIVVGDEIIEAPMAWRSRFFEYRPYRKLIKEYFHKGARWTTAPKPMMGDDFFVKDYEKAPGKWITTEFEPCFDAAEFARFGTDLVCQRSQVTNEFGIEWMRRHLGDKYQVHELDFRDQDAMHIDTTLVPLADGRVMFNPKRPCVTGEVRFKYEYNGEEREYRLPPGMFKDWEFLPAPDPSPEAEALRHYFTSGYTATANIVIIDDHKVVCEAHEEETIKTFESWGFETVPVPFRHVLPFGGSFHCVTSDIRRSGPDLKSYIW